jgi:hypothetical protein
MVDGSAKSTSSITVADADGIIIIDGTTTKQIPASDLKTYAGFTATTITGTTALAENPAKTDEIILSDGGTLKRLDLTHLYPTPLVHARTNTTPNVATGTATKLVLDTEVIDSDGKFDASSNYRFTPTVAGYYYAYASAEFVNTDSIAYIVLYKNGSADSSNIGRGNMVDSSDSSDESVVQTASLVYLDADDYLEAFVEQSSGGDKTVRYGRLIVFKVNHGGTSS